MALDYLYHFYYFRDYFVDADQLIKRPGVVERYQLSLQIQKKSQIMRHKF